MLKDYIATTTRWSFAVCSSIVQALSRRQEQLAQHYRAVRSGVEGAADPETIQSRMSEIALLEHRLAEASAAVRRLALLEHNMARAPSSAAGRPQT